MRQYISKNFWQFIILGLIFILFLQRCNDRDKINESPNVVVKIDTVWFIRDTIVYGKPQLIYGQRDTIFENSIEYIPSDDYAELAQQFQQLKEDLLSKNTYRDTLKIDSIGYVSVEDQIQRNQVLNRKYRYSLKYPEITKTITTTLPSKKQFYVGGGLGGNEQQLISTVDLGILYKDKKDRIFGAKVIKNLEPNLPITYGVSSYWKIKLKK